jgi:hypothetical protein
MNDIGEIRLELHLNPGRRIQSLENVEAKVLA